MPEVDLALPVSEKMAALLLARLPRRTVAEALNTGRRFTGPDAVAAGIADEICPESEVLESAIAWAATIAPKSREVIGTHKEMLHGEVIRILGA
jgi:enoyl-CoA hydratase/carnithine racemase